MQQHIKYWFFILLCVGCAACVNFESVKGSGHRISKVYPLKDFTDIKIEGTYNVELMQGSSDNVRVESDDNIIPVVKVESKNQELHILASQPFLSDSGVNIVITVKNLKSLTTVGAMNLKSSQKLALDHFTLKDEGASIINMDLNCVSLTVESNGSSTVNLLGATVDFDVEVKGSSVINSKNLITDNAIVLANGSTICNVNVLSSLNITAKGTSEVNYYGTPEVSIKKSNSAYVNKVFNE